MTPQTVYLYIEDVQASACASDCEPFANTCNQLNYEGDCLWGNTFVGAGCYPSVRFLFGLECEAGIVRARLAIILSDTDFGIDEEVFDAAVLDCTCFQILFHSITAGPCRFDFPVVEVQPDFCATQFCPQNIQVTLENIGPPTGSCKCDRDTCEALNATWGLVRIGPSGDGGVLYQTTLNLRCAPQGTTVEAYGFCLLQAVLYPNFDQVTGKCELAGKVSLFGDSFFNPAPGGGPKEACVDVERCQVRWASDVVDDQSCETADLFCRLDLDTDCLCLTSSGPGCSDTHPVDSTARIEAL